MDLPGGGRRRLHCSSGPVYRQLVMDATLAFGRMAQEERRRDARMPLSLPVRAQGNDLDGKAWNEMTSSADASHNGASFFLKHSVAVHQVLLLSMPLPKSFRRYAIAEQSYRVFGLVRDVRASGPGTRVGVMFLGKNAPKGYEQNPGGLYLLPNDAPPPPKERRQFQRIENLFVNLRLRSVIEGEGREEKTFAENMGKGGARVMTTLRLAKGEIIEIEELSGGFKTRAEI